MELIVHDVVDQESFQAEFDVLYTSSEPYMTTDNNPWIGIPVPDGSTAQEKFTQSFFAPLALPVDTAIGVGKIIKVTIDGTTVSTFSGLFNNGIYHINYALYGSLNSSRTWLYDRDTMLQHITSIKDYFSSLNGLGYTVTAPYGSTLYNYHKNNKPVMEVYSSITEEVHPHVPEARVITFLI